MHFSSFGIHTRFIQATEQGCNDHLLIALINLVELQNSTLSGFEYFWQIKMLHVVKGKAIDKTLIDAPGQCVNSARIVSTFAIIVTFLLRDTSYSYFEISYGPGCVFFSLFDFTQSTAQKVLLFLCHLG